MSSVSPLLCAQQRGFAWSASLSSLTRAAAYPFAGVVPSRRQSVRAVAARGILCLWVALLGGAAAQAQSVAALSLVPAGVTGGTSVTGTVTLSAAATANRSVTLSSTNAATGQFSSCVVYQGQTQGSFSVATNAVSSQTSGLITARTTGAGASQTLTVYPPDLDPVNGLTLSPNPVGGGQNANASIFLTGPAPSGGLTVHLTTSNTQFVALGNSDPTVAIQMLPVDIAIPAGQQSVSVVLATAWANYTQSATVTTALGSQSQTQTLTLLGANLHLTDILGPNRLRLKWDGITTTGQFLLTRDGATLATLASGTTSYDDVFAGGFTTGQAYLYQLFDTNVTRTTTSQLSSEKVAPYLIAAAASQAVDSRLDLRYSDNHYLDHRFGAATYKGGLFAGMASDPARVGRSFARVSIPAATQGSSFFRMGGLMAYCTGLAGSSASSVSVGAQIIPNTTWDFPTLAWTGTAPDTFTPGAGSATTISYDPANPNPQWVAWPLPDAIKGALLAATPTAPTPLTFALAGMNESQPGWAYFAKREYNPALAPGAAYALAQPVPVAAYRIYPGGTGSVWHYNIIMNGLNPGESVAVLLTDGGNHQAMVSIDSLHHVVQCYAGGVDGYIPVYNLATCNGVSVPIQTVQGGGGPQPGPGGGGGVFGGGSIN